MFLSLLFSMLSKIERAYIGDPENFEKRNRDSYVRKVRNNIRKKVGISAEEISKIIQFSETKYDKDNSKIGRNRKSIIPAGSIDILKESINWIESDSKNKKKIEKKIEENIQKTMYSIFKDTKIGKELY